LLTNILVVDLGEVPEGRRGQAVSPEATSPAWRRRIIYCAASRLGTQHSRAITR
jgi:hypothetical protein